MKIGDLVDTISLRIRDENNVGSSRALIRRLIDYVQTQINLEEAYVVNSQNITLEPGVAIYAFDNNAPGFSIVTDLRINDIPLERSDWNTLWKLSLSWLNDAGYPYTWARAGRTLIAVYPVPDITIQATLYGPKILDAVSSDDQDFELRDEEGDIVIDLVTSLLLFRQRDIDMVGAIAVRASDRVRVTRG